MIRKTKKKLYFSLLNKFKLFFLQNNQQNKQQLRILKTKLNLMISLLGRFYRSYVPPHLETKYFNISR